MNVIDVLVKQTQDAHTWTNNLIDSVPFEHWNDTPDVLESNISWQVGHLILSEYYHAILVIKGFDKEVIQKLDIREYSQKFGYDSTPTEHIESSNVKTLREELQFMHTKVIDTISGLTLTDLENNVEEPFKQKHPVATTKFDAVSWNIKHTMWHCGQVATLKRLINGGYDFGLPKRS